MCVKRNIIAGCVVLMVMLSTPLNGAAQWDTASAQRPQIVAPVSSTVLMASGAAFTFIPEMKAVEVNLRDAIQADGHDRLFIEDYVQYLTPSLPPMLKLCGLESRHSFWKMSMLEGGSYLLGFTLLEAGKYGFGVQRPDNTAYNSFPSGHTFTAFTGAEVLRREYGEEYPWLAVAGYTVATFVGAMRVYNNRHWLGDVLAGAGLGIMSVSLVYFIDDKLCKGYGL